ncbi:uncharacterized protein LOC123550225 [Mercenaria mercenaria]|uniref:uncharacterized protein LOC123550225 n=1 Tax=Mercenaria mercenaria TaxID=6596 RepID=UPI00234E46F1|nr:uncharacterized protein LOC123550225 [Mercenaria mercenaria]
MKKMKLTLPYNLDTLTWDQQHKNNVEATYCYCGGPGIWFQKMLQCCRCKQWYHEACMQCLEYQLLYADSFYIFVCSPCNAGNEYIKRLDVDWADLVHIGLFNLAVMQKRKYFDLDGELMPWLLENWDQLQVNKYTEITEDEKEVEVKNALESNKTRFTNGSEVRKKWALWGLRVRVPPPRIHITLPFTGQVTDELMNKLKIKGRRSKVFMPVECKSPVNQIHYSPLHARGAVKKRLDAVALGQGECKYSPSKHAGSPGKSARKPKKLPFLETLIPLGSSFVGCNHPFKTEIEQSAEKAEQKIRAKIWNKFLETFDCNEEVESSTGITDFVPDDPPVLEKVEPVVPTISCNGTPPMPEIQEKKPGRKSVPKLEKNNEKRGSDRQRRRKSTQRTNVPVDIANDSAKEDDFTVKHVKSVAGGNYYCCHDKFGYGRGFSVMGRRVDSMGRVEYMVKWD